MEELELENKKLKESLDFKSDIISMMSHQLRTSLSASKWILKMLLDEDLGSLTQEQKSFIEKNYENNEKMICLVSEMIEVNREGGTEIPYDFQESNIVEVIDDTLMEFIGKAKQKKVTLNFTKPSDITIECDVSKIKTALQGLTENSIKYNKEGGKVFVSVEKELDSVLISFKDTGIGISEEDQGQIFNKFFRTVNAKKKESVGSGLGLFALKKIIERHGGKIWFKSKEGEGSTFFMSLPISRS